jgi:hypothetical protein
MKMKNTAIIVASLLLVAANSVSAVNCVNNIPPSNPDAAYTVHNDGTATDTRTGLMWKVCAEGQTWSAGTCSGSATVATWDVALGWAEASNFVGRSDWRLPNLKELRSLVEECRSRPSINDSVFPSAPVSGFWSGSPYAGGSDYVWNVAFDLGSPYYVSHYNYSSVRLVRGGQ